MFPKAAVIVSIPLIIFLMLVGLVVGDSRIQSDFESQVGPARLSGATNSTSTVTKTTDSNDGVCNTDCSLREAIAVAASGTAIVIPVGTYTLALGSQLTIDRSLTLIGAQASTTIIQAATQPGTASFPVFGISNGDVEISDLTIRHGNATGNGGGISNSANLTLNGVRLTENRATASGGAVANFNTLIVTNSRFRNNHAGIQGGALYNDGFADLNGVTLSANTTDNAGGGIRNVLNRAVTLNNVNISENSASIIGGGIFNDGTVHLSDSVVDGNSSSDGAGLYNNGTLTLINSTVSLNIATSAGGGITNSKPDANVGVLSLMNSTISGNKATGPGGGIVNSGGTSSLTNSTITNNSSDAKGGGVWADTAKLSNTVIADNMAPSAANCFANSQPFTSVGHNLVGDLGGCNYTPGPGDITGIVDAKLGPLQDNGGPTFTHALKPGSPAIDAGDDSAAPNTDQRGVARPQGPASDIGAFERIPEQPPEVDFLPNATTTGDAPLTIQFIDTSAGAPTSWLWNFGDGATSSQRNPSHTYNRGGVFTVGLTAAYGSGTSTIAKFGLVNVTGLVSKIAYHSTHNGKGEIWVMNADGSGQASLTDSPTYGEQPAWSPDGLRIAFHSTRDGDREIYTMSHDGANQTNITNDPAMDFHAAWSSDGSQIAFRSDRTGNHEIFVMSSGGADQTNLTSNSAVDSAPDWSPDGVTIAFNSDRDGGGGSYEGIYSINTHGSDLTRLTNSATRGEQPDWSPDGANIAFSSYVGQYEIYVMSAEGTGYTNLTNNSANDWDPAWSPDGAKIAFSSYRDGDQEIYVMNANGSGQTRLTNHSGGDVEPAWSPAVFPQIPGGLATTTPSTNDTPTFTWNPTPSTQSYEVRFDGKSGGSWENVGATTTATASSSLAVGDHTIEVRAIAVTGFAGTVASSTFTVTSILPPRCRYDFNDSLTIERDEAVAIVTDYLLKIPGGKKPKVIPTRPEAVDIVTAYLLQLQFTCP